MKEKNFYILKCVAKKECEYKNITIKPGDTFYFNPRASSREMSDNWSNNPYRGICGYSGSLPFVRNSNHAKKWQKKDAAEWYISSIERRGEFDVELVTITVKYEII